MRIIDIETFVVDTAWRPWIFVKEKADEGITDYGECSEFRSVPGIVGTI
mgnify:CR=1 FL=1